MAQLALFETAARASDRVAVIDSTSPCTYGQLVERAARVCSALLSDTDDLREQRIAFLVEPGYDHVATQWGIWQSGGVCVPLAISHPPPELEHVLSDADVAAVVVQPELRDRVAPLAAARSVPLITTDRFTSLPPHNELPPLSDARRAMILYTSGSTGRPKGVVTTHGNIRAQVEALVAAWEWHSSDHILHVLPLHHIHGVINVLTCALYSGAVCEFLCPFDARRVWQRLARGDLSLFMAVPTVYAKLIAEFERAPAADRRVWSAGASRLRLMVSGSAALPVATLEKWEQITGHRLLERYGMTEIGMALSNPLHGPRRPGYVGSPLPRLEIRRIDDMGEVCDDSTPGEIEVRGPGVFLEYWRQPKATRSSFRDGWFRTGDVAVVDQGDFRILGRSSVDIIKTGGYKVSALEIEDVLRTHPAIRDCAVVGVADELWGERVAACAVLCDGAALECESLREWGKRRLAAYKVPTLLRVCDELPRNAMGKVQKPAVRRLFEDP